MARVKFGVSLGYHPSPAEQLALAERIEALGYDSVWSGDHISFHNPGYESLALLSAYAVRTSRVMSPISRSIRARSSGVGSRGYATAMTRRA